MVNKLPELWAHQKEGVRRASALPWFNFWFEMGTGKSRTAIETLRVKFNEKQRIMRTLILCPPIVINNWQEEWFKYSAIEQHLVVKLQGSGKKRLNTFLEHIENNTNRVFITNFEALLMPELYSAFTRWQPEVIVIDEAHRIRSHDAKRSQALEELCNPIDRKLKCISPNRAHVYCLTGTPVLKDALDLFQQFKVLLSGFPLPKFFETYDKDPIAAQQFLIRNYYTFRARYFRDENAGWKGNQGYFPSFVIKEGAEEEINSLVYQCSMRVTKGEALDLPPEIIVPIKVGMTPDQEKNYAELRKDFVTHVSGERVSADLAMVKALRLLQITSGFISIDQAQGSEDDPVKISYPKTPKLEALRELLEAITPNSKCLVWCVWKENYVQIKNLLTEMGLKYVEVHGSISPADKEEAVRNFQSDDSYRIFLGHPGSGGIGINLVQAPYSIFFSRTFSLEQWLQARARNHRGGSKEQGHTSITHYDLFCEGTIDELATIAREQKVEMGARLLDTIKQNLQKI